MVAPSGPLRCPELFESLSRTDDAFARLCSYRAEIAQHAACKALITDILRFEERIATLELAFGGEAFAAMRADLEEMGSTTGGPHGRDASEGFVEWMDLHESMEEIAGAFVVVIQDKFRELHKRAERVFDVASDELGAVAPKKEKEPVPNKKKGEEKLQHPSSFNIWALANYVKHHAEWPEEYDKLKKEYQKPTCDALSRMGLIERFERDGCQFWNAQPRLVSTGIRLHADTTAPLSACLNRLVREFESYGDDLARCLQQEFSSFEPQLERARKEAKQHFQDLLERGGPDHL